MKDKQAIELLNYIENKDVPQLDPDLLNEADSLRELAQDLKKVNALRVDETVDQHIWNLSGFAVEKDRQVRLRKLLPYAAIAAVLLLILNLVIQPKSLDQAYNNLSSNPEKLGFIHKLNQNSMDKNELFWLQDQLLKEDNPNIRVAIVDILNSASVEPETEVFEILAYEEIPAVQMAILEYAQPYAASLARSALLSLAERPNLEPTVSQKVNEILSSIN